MTTRAEERMESFLAFIGKEVGENVADPRLPVTNLSVVSRRRIHD